METTRVVYEALLAWTARLRWLPLLNNPEEMVELFRAVIAELKLSAVGPTYVSHFPSRNCPVQEMRCGGKGDTRFDHEKNIVYCNLTADGDEPGCPSLYQFLSESGIQMHLYTFLPREKGKRFNGKIAIDLYSCSGVQGPRRVHKVVSSFLPHRSIIKKVLSVNAAPHL
ncbi:MAG: hypothetical protein HY459_02655 [Parcubacteria group bacterium]|nr:hypothetical protein [Parcubacteria group bacterium]